MQSSDTTTCAIGDIHGCVHALSALFLKISERASTVVLLGDYVDRGPDSKKVVETILQWRKNKSIRVIALMGNHDFLFLQYLSGQASDLFFKVGGLETLSSYGLTPSSSRQEREEKVPREHFAFFNSLPLLWQDKHAIYVHAGLEPGRHLSQQSSQWCLWYPKNFDQCRFNFGKPVVFGHKVYKTPYISSDRIGIDTGAVFAGSLTAILLPSRETIRVPANTNFQNMVHDI
nr:metallophosphoesterase family protein [uncultured Desulfobulbus sp.]